ncbi:hypothetical protein WMY93_005218 [Mugilogobius chulae]|uniref:LRRCT domain-containing protein n=1 Tax=Mugilogobius chulae TaxID=88201 RepID=A0AAW0PQG3_9GOBI
MKGTFLLVLLLKCFHQNNGCAVESAILICPTIPANFPSGSEVKTFLLVTTDLGEINSTVFHHDIMASVTSVIFKGVGITSIAEGAFSSFFNLSRLVLDRNKLTAINYKWLGRPDTLTELTASENQISVLSGVMLEELTNLNKLDLRRNQISSIHPHTFSNLAALTLLDLSDNNLTHLTSEMFSPLRITSMCLQGNRWHCSCDAQDFLKFIMDLKNKALLVRPYNVTCASPLLVRGQPVWNVSECRTPTSEGPRPTNAALTTSPGLNVTRPTTDKITPFNPRTTHNIDSTSALHHPPSYTTNIVLMLITVIVVLCVILLFVIILALLYRRKRKRKRVAPRDQSKLVTVEKDHYKAEVAEHMRWDKETPAPTSLTGARAKSANAILFTSPFGISGDFHVEPALMDKGENQRGGAGEAEVL